MFAGSEPTDRPDERTFVVPPAMQPKKGEAGFAGAYGRLSRFDAAEEVDRRPMRLVVAWRFCRFIVRIVGAGDPQASLTQRIAETDAWNEVPVVTVINPRHPHRRILRWLSGDVPEAAEVAGVTAPALGLAPPLLPEFAVDPETGVVDPNYDPRADGPLTRWLKVFEAAVSWLGVRNGTPQDREFGILAIRGLDDPWEVRRLWPSRTEIEVFDDFVTMEASKEFVEGGVEAATSKLRTKYGLQFEEMREILGAVRRDLVVCHSLTADEARATITARLDAVLKTARESHDNRTVLNSLKLLSIVQGVAKSEPQNEDANFLRQANDVATKQGSNPVPALTLDAFDNIAK